MTIKEITAWEDSKGVVHKTLTAAEQAEANQEKQKQVNDVVNILSNTSRALGRPKTSLPATTEEAAQIAIAAYPSLKEYFDG